LHLRICYSFLYFISSNASQIRSLLNVESKVQNTVGVAPLVVVPTDNLVEVVVEANACLSVND
jgi:hypothetical protein